MVDLDIYDNATICEFTLQFAYTYILLGAEGGSIANHAVKGDRLRYDIIAVAILSNNSNDENNENKCCDS